MARMKRPRPSLDEILRILQAHLPELRGRYGVRTLGVFGSYVRGEQRPRSDLDLLVEFDERPLTLIQVIALEHYLSDLLGVKVDLVEKSSLKPVWGLSAPQCPPLPLPRIAGRVM
jgi:predicted nucleotidyltransferase